MNITKFWEILIWIPVTLGPLGMLSLLAILNGFYYYCKSKNQAKILENQTKLLKTETTKLKQEAKQLKKKYHDSNKKLNKILTMTGNAETHLDLNNDNLDKLRHDVSVIKNAVTVINKKGHQFGQEKLIHMRAESPNNTELKPSKQEHEVLLHELTFRQDSNDSKRKPFHEILPDATLLELEMDDLYADPCIECPKLFVKNNNRKSHKSNVSALPKDSID